MPRAERKRNGKRDGVTGRARFNGHRAAMRLRRLRISDSDYFLFFFGLFFRGT